MKCNTIITIGRQYGSNGRKIGQALAKELDIKCYDRELLDRAAKDSGICQELFENHDERPTSSFLYSLVMDIHSFGYAGPSFNDMPINYKVFMAQFESIKSIAKEGPCVIIGRCADYALADFKNCLNVFLYSDIEKRITNIAARYDYTRDKAKDIINKTDKQRASYYNYYTSKKWGDPKSYHMCLDSEFFGIDGVIEIIKDAIALKEGHHVSQ